MWMLYSDNLGRLPDLGDEGSCLILIPTEGTCNVWLSLLFVLDSLLLSLEIILLLLWLFSEPAEFISLVFLCVVWGFGECDLGGAIGHWKDDWPSDGDDIGSKGKLKGSNNIEEDNALGGGHAKGGIDENQGGFGLWITAGWGCGGGGITGVVGGALK